MIRFMNVYQCEKRKKKKAQTADSTDRAHGPVLSMRDIWQTAVLLSAKGLSNGQFSVFIGNFASRGSLCS